ncbi:MAG: hypothetical protein GYB66_15740 [Chloroflexi bacterium]|nr:hypothetical protein [Chloroflexota bacterium]
MNRHLFLTLAVLVLLLAALLRIYNLNAQGLWGDEGWSVEFSDPENPAEVSRRLVDDLHPPFYFILLSGWRQVAGDSVIVMRLIAVYAALISIALMVHLGRQLFSLSAGLLGALILALADKHIVLSQEVRHYTLAFMLMALSSAVFLRWLKQPSRTNTLLYAVTILLALYTHYYTMIILLVQITYAAVNLRPWQRFGHLVSIVCLSTLGFAPWSLVAIHQLDIRPEGILHSMDLSYETAEFLAIDYLGRPVSLIGGLLLLGILRVAAQKRDTAGQKIVLPRGTYGVLWVVLPVALTIAVYPWVTVLTDRNLALLLLPIALMAGYGAALFAPPARIILALILLANGVTSLDSYFDHPPWREMAQYVAANHPHGEPVIMDVLGGDKALRYHLEHSLPEGTTIYNLNQLRLDHGAYFLGVLDATLQEHDGFWMAHWVNPNQEWDAADPLSRHGYTRTATHFEYHQGNPIAWYHYDRVPPDSQSLGRYDDTIVLYRAKFPGELTASILDVSLLWGTSRSLETSYSVSVFLLDQQGRLQAQHDGPPQGGLAPTNTWRADAVYFDHHHIPISGINNGEYQLAVKIYNSANGQVLAVTSGNGQTPEEYLIVGTVLIQSNRR